MSDEEKGSPIPCDITCYDGSPGASEAIGECQRRVRSHTAICRDFNRWLLENEPLEDSGTNRKQEVLVEGLRRERDDALEKIKRVVALCALTVERYQRKGFSEQGVGPGGSLASIPVAAVWDQLGLPPYNTEYVECVAPPQEEDAPAWEAGPPEPPCADGVAHPRVIFPASLEPLEGLFIEMRFPALYTNVGGSVDERAWVKLAVELPEDPMVAVEVCARMQRLSDKREPVRLVLWDESETARTKRSEE